ncbi:MAG: LexA family transcriptional regulator [Rhodospirillales bacterium]|nr:LexA family transcriptional regulator [Rhodospirillales bacterium]
MTVLRMDERLRAARRNARLSQARLADLLGISQPTVSEWEKGVHYPSRKRMEAIARITATTVEWLEFGLGGETSGRVSVVGVVRAGDWREALELPSDEWVAVDVPADPRFPIAPRFALKVDGASMNNIFPAGSIVICVKFMDLDRQPRDKEYVVVRRRRTDGLMEATVKQYVLHGDKPWLWPRSTDPAFQQPLDVKSHGEDDEVVIDALVVGCYQPI